MAFVSVIIPAKNNAGTIGATIDSCLSDDAVKELLVVVHASHDGTAQVARKSGDARVSVIEDEGRGISRAMNVGLTASSGSYLAKIDADDIVPAGRFSQQSEFLDAHPDIMAVCGTFDAIDDHGRHLASFARDRVAGDVTREYHQQKRPSHFGSWLCRREGWEKVGGFREWFITGEDLDMAFRLALVGRIWFQPEPAYFYRVREGSITRTQATTLRKFYEEYSIRFARQRIATGTDDLEQGKPPPLPEIDAASQDGTELLAAQTVGFLTAQAWREFQRGEVGIALRTMLRSISYAKGWRKARQLRGLMIMAAKGAIGRH